MKLHYIGIITDKIEEDIFLYLQLGYAVHEDIVDIYQNNRIVMLKLNFSPLIELIEPINETSSVYNFRTGYHHIYYEGDDNENLIHKFNDMKIGKIFTKPVQAPAIGNRNVVFACRQNGTFIEIP